MPSRYCQRHGGPSCQEVGDECPEAAGWLTPFGRRMHHLPREVRPPLTASWGCEVGPDPHHRDRWEKNAKDLVANLRAEAGRNPHDRALTDLVGELSTRSEPFRQWWAARNVRHHQTGRKRLHHPTVGELELDYEVMDLAGDHGLRLAIFTAEPRSRSAEAFDLLASWTATPPTPTSRPQTP